MKKLIQLRPLLAIAKADLLSLSKNPSTLAFNLIFPVVFILVLGFVSGTTSRFNLILDDKDSNTLCYQTLKQHKSFVIKPATPANRALLLRGKIMAEVRVLKTNADSVSVNLLTASSASEQFAVFEAYFKNLMREATTDKLKQKPVLYFQKTLIHTRVFKRIDFLLPGMLGFSLLSAGLFGVAYSFFGLRQNMVFKRIFCTPVSKTSVLLGLLLSRVSFQFFNSIILIALGYFAFGFTLIHGWVTLFYMLLMSLLGLVCFMSWGFFISGVAKNDAIIPALTNILSLPQWLLGGVFFSNDDFPTWLKNIAQMMPLTHLNEGLRQIAFDGLGFGAILPSLSMLLIWTLLGLFLSKKFFRWQ